MWSARDVKSVDEAAPRLARMFCRLAARGFRASPHLPRLVLQDRAVRRRRARLRDGPSVTDSLIADFSLQVSVLLAFQ
jgi:hypothetical protein